MNKTLFYNAIACFLLLLSCHNNNMRQDYVSGKVVKVLDGDTYDLLVENNRTIRVRMEGIDAPEKGMPFSNKATLYLRELCNGQTVKIKTTNLDRYGRTISFSYLEDGRELSREMLKAGYAWHYKQYNTDPELADLEKKAREAKLGLWQDKNPMPPWEVRKLHRKGISTKGMYER